MKITIQASHLVLAAILVGAVFGGYMILQPSPAAGNYDAFAQCLTENGAVMYGAEWCGHCKAQKAMFGSSFELVNYVECPQNQTLCAEKGITGYPTWIIDGAQYVGQQPLETLSSITGCVLEQG